MLFAQSVISITYFSIIQNMLFFRISCLTGTVSVLRTGNLQYSGSVGSEQMDGKIEVRVVDDDAQVRRSIEVVLRSLGLVVTSYASAQAFLEHDDPEVPGCLLLDVILPGMNGLALQQLLARTRRGPPMILMSGFGTIDVATRAMKSGAVDFLEKPFGCDALIERVQEALAIDARTRRQRSQTIGVAARLESLTRREREVLRLVLDGLSSREIAAHLGRSEQTVQLHRARIMKKLQVRGVANLVRALTTIELQGGLLWDAPAPS